jgi:hypothetical protein
METPMQVDMIDTTTPTDEPGAVVRLVREGPIPKASCPHCGGQLQLSTLGSRWQVRSASDVADRLMLQLGQLEREELHVVILNTRHVVVGQERVYQGNVSASLVRVGELFTEAVRRQAGAIILVHNHPSGDPTPSSDDLHLTAEAIAAGRLLDVQVVDHVIVAGGGWVSLRDRGIAFDAGRVGHTVGEEPVDPKPYGRLYLTLEGQVEADTGIVLPRFGEAVELIPWVTATLYPPPHQYVIFRRCPRIAWDVVATTIAKHPTSYLAFFRGYLKPNRYFEFEGRRYWRTANSRAGGVTHMLNRGRFEDAEPPRRVDEGAKPMVWDGPPWEPYGTPWPSWYTPDPSYPYGMRDDSKMGGGPPRRGPRG